MDITSKVLHSPSEMEKEAASLVNELEPEATHATLITLSGELGAGKTTFTQFLAKALGVDDTVNSPTFVIERIYDIPENAAARYARLVHIDAYRLQNDSELTALGFEEIMSHPKNLIMLEWPENVPIIAQQAQVRLVFKALSDESRQITYA